MPFPANRVEMLSQGYKRGETKTCRACPATVEFWSTPAGRAIPMDVMNDDETKAVSHFATCPEADRFRRKK